MGNGRGDSPAVKKLKTEYDSIILIAGSIGAYFSMNADIDSMIEGVFHIADRRYGKADHRYDGMGERHGG